MWVSHFMVSRVDEEAPYTLRPPARDLPVPVPSFFQDAKGKPFDIVY